MIKWIDKFDVKGKGIVYTIYCDGELPFEIGDSITLEDVGSVTIIDIERSLKLTSPPTYSNIVGLLIRNNSAID